MGQGLTLVGRALLPGGQRLKVRAWGRPYELTLPLAGAVTVNR